MRMMNKKILRFVFNPSSCSKGNIILTLYFILKFMDNIKEVTAVSIENENPLAKLQTAWNQFFAIYEEKSLPRKQLKLAIDLGIPITTTRHWFTDKTSDIIPQYFEPFKKMVKTIPSLPLHNAFGQFEEYHLQNKSRISFALSEPIGKTELGKTLIDLLNLLQNNKYSNRQVAIAIGMIPSNITHLKYAGEIYLDTEKLEKLESFIKTVSFPEIKTLFANYKKLGAIPFNG
jgi:hypothetical protein